MEQTANLCTTDACEVLSARLAKYEDAEGRPLRAVVMPEPLKRGDEGGSGEYGAAMIRGYNACLREVARLNSSPVSAGEPAKCSYQDEPRSPSELSLAGCNCVRFGECNPHWPCKIHPAVSAGGVDDRAHPDEIAVDRFAVAMKEKLAKSREKGRHGWQNATQPHLSSLLYGHMYKADPLDVANLAMMLHQNGQAIELPWHARLNPHFKIPLGWRAQKTDGGDGFIVSSPRVNGVASNTAVFVDSPCPAHRMLFDVLAALTASAPSSGEQVREALAELLECPASVVQATVPRAGIDAAPPYQVVLDVSVSLTRWRKAQAALKAAVPSAGSQGDKP